MTVVTLKILITIQNKLKTYNINVTDIRIVHAFKE